MSTFKVPVCRIETIQPHPKADRLELARIRGVQVVLRKGEYQVGDLVALLPEQTLVPEWLLKSMNLWDESAGKGRLAGPLGNRVHPVELRGELSMAMPVGGAQLRRGQADAQLELHTPRTTVLCVEGDDMAQVLECTKYIPQPPAELQGEAFALELRLAARFDVEDVHHHLSVMSPGEEVVVLEKIHGLFTGIADVRGPDETLHGRRLVVSKGLTDQGLGFIPQPHGKRNAYLRAAEHVDAEVFARLRVLLRVPDEPVWVLGETFGQASQQDLHYGTELGFRVFALAVGYRYDLRYIDFDVVHDLVQVVGLKMPAVLYRGPFDLERIEAACQGKEQVSGHELHIREGGVVVPVKERKHPDLETGRVALKCISPDYRKRPSGTEYR